MYIKALSSSDSALADHCARLQIILLTYLFTHESNRIESLNAQVTNAVMRRYLMALENVFQVCMFEYECARRPLQPRLSQSAIVTLDELRGPIFKTS